MNRCNLVASALLLVPATVVASGCGGKKGGGTPGIEVTGQVLDVSDEPVANAEVLVNGVLVTTDSAGNFDVTNVQTPYTLVLSDTATQRILVYDGATRPDPVLRIGTSVSHTAMVSGVLAPSAASGDGFVAAEGSMPIGYIPPPTGLNTFSTQVNWYDSSTTHNARLTAARYTTDASGLVDSIAGYGTLDVSLVDGVAQTNLSISIDSTVSSGTINASMQMPQGYTTYKLYGDAVNPDGAVFLALGVSTASSATFTDIADSGFRAASFGIAFPPGAVDPSQGLSAGLVVSNPTGSAVVPIAPLVAITQPAANATLVAGDTVAWTPGNSNSGFQAVLYPATAGTSIQIITDASSITIPDLSALSAAPATQAYTLTLDETAPASSVDDQLGTTASTLGDTFQFSESAPIDVTAGF